MEREIYLAAWRRNKPAGKGIAVSPSGGGMQRCVPLADAMPRELAGAVHSRCFRFSSKAKKPFVTAAGIEAALAHQRFAGSAFSPFAVTRREDRVGGEDGTRSRIRRGPSAALMARWDSGFGRGNPLTRGLGREWVGMAFAAWCGRGGAPFLPDGKFVNNCTNRKRTLEIRLIF